MSTPLELVVAQLQADLQATEGTIAQLQATVDAQANILAHQSAQQRQLVAAMRKENKKKRETYYQTLLEGKLNAKRSRIPGVGTTDLTTNDAHIEIKNWDNYMKVPGQLASYHQGLPRAKSAVYFFGILPTLKRVNHIRTLMTAHKIAMYSIDEDDEIVDYPLPPVQVNNAPDDHAVAFDDWFNNHSVLKPNKRVHVHRFERAFKVDTSDCCSIKTIAESLAMKGFSVSEVGVKGKHRDGACCDSPSRCVLGVDVAQYGRYKPRIPPPSR